MKSLTLSLILLGLMLICIVGNYIYINEVSARMDRLLDEFPEIGSPACEARASEICDYWAARVDTVGLSVCYTTVDRVSEQAATLQACAACGDVYGLHTALALLRDAIGDVRRLEAFSIGNLF
ncbi:MAG: hypothetical protein IKJ35_01880 [Clostridia bacterium]|nr:hypothetical protein [Clostridia bacterium]